MLSSPVILTLLAGSATFIGAIFGVIGQKPSNRLLGFSLGFAAGIMLLISLMEMLPAALATEGMSPLLGYGMFIIGLLGYFALDRMLPHAHPQDLMSPGISRPRNLRRTAILLTLGISLHNFPEGIATFVTASNNLELGMGVALAVALHNIPEGLAVAGPVYAATGSRSKAVFWAGLSGMEEIFGGVLAWLTAVPSSSTRKGSSRSLKSTLAASAVTHWNCCARSRLPSTFAPTRTKCARPNGKKAKRLWPRLWTS